MSEKKTERTRRTSEKKKERMKNDIPGTFFDSFGPPSPALIRQVLTQARLRPILSIYFSNLRYNCTLVELKASNII